MESMVCVRDFKEFAQRYLPKPVWDYYSSGAGYEQTLRENEEAYTRWRLRPRMLRDISHRRLATTVLGSHIDFPLGISPTAMQKMAHPQGELATARAASKMNTVMILSTLSTSTIEEVSAAAPNSARWFQLYICTNRSVTEQLVRRAEGSGFKALVLTVDAQRFGLRIADIKNKFSPLPHLGLANLVSLEGDSPDPSKRKELIKYVADNFDPSITWDALKWLRKITSLPIVVKGVLTAEDAELAVESGADAVMVSNHGGRQLDGVFATIDALPEVVEAIKGRCEVYVDGGVTMGTDILKALALGARAVFIGRPVLWGLAYQGEDGVQKVLEIFKKEFDLAMALAGCSSIADIKPSLVTRSSLYPRL